MSTVTDLIDALMEERSRLLTLVVERDEARGEAEYLRFQLNHLPERIAAVIDQRRNWGYSAAYTTGLRDAADLARNFDWVQNAPEVQS